MSTTNSMIRLVGGPRILDGSTHDLSLDAHGRADVDDDRFVRAMRNSTVVDLGSLQARCSNRETADELADNWRAVVFRPGRDRRVRARLYLYEATYRLVATRDHLGEWTLIVGDPIIGSARLAPASTTTSTTAASATAPGTTTWTMLEQAVDRAAARFAQVAALLPPGPLAERASATRRAVASCVADAARLCGVGLAVAPDWQPEAGSMPGAGSAIEIANGRTAALACQVEALLRTIDAATTHLVDLHLEIGDGLDPVEPVAHLVAAWGELGTA